MAVTEESKLAQKVQEESPSEVKFSEEELKSLADLQQGYQAKQQQFGQLRVQRLLLNQQLEGLDEAELRIETDYSELQKQESELVQSLNKKYGPGNLDPNTGVFTPAPTQAEQAS